MHTYPSPTARPPVSLLGAFCYREGHARVAGQGLVEYALLLVLIAIVTIGAISLVGRETSQVFAEINCNMEGGTWHTDQGNGNSSRCR